MIQQLNNDFRQEIGSKQSNLDQIHAQVVLVTRELAEERRKITAAQNLVKEVEAIQQQSHDLEKVLPLEATFEWYPGQADSVAQDATIDPIVDRSSGSTLVQLRRIRTWQRRTEGLLDQKLLDVAATSAEKTAKYRKVIATCVKLPVEQVDEVSDVSSAQFLSLFADCFVSHVETPGRTDESGRQRCRAARFWQDDGLYSTSQCVTNKLCNRPTRPPLYNLARITL